MTAVSRFTDALGEVLGTTSLAEYYMRRAGDLGLRQRGARGRGKVWTVDDIAAVAAAFLVSQSSGPVRQDAEWRLRGGDGPWRDSVLGGMRQALLSGREIRLDLGGDFVRLSLVIAPEAVAKLAALVDDWGDLRDVREDREAA